MQNLVDNKAGVSPAYFVSRCGTKFTWKDLVSEAGHLKEMGFNYLQLEILDKSIDDSWNKRDFAFLMEVMQKCDLRASVFVAHFLGTCFTSPSLLKAAERGDDMARVLDLMENLDPSIPLAVPLLPPADSSPPDAQGLIELLGAWQELVEDADRQLILEVLPGSAPGSYTSLLTEPAWRNLSPRIGFLLDTGHACGAGEDIPELIRMMGGRLKALHISDSDGKSESSLVPGRGIIGWAGIVESLERTGYSGSFDLEIAAASGACDALYLEGKRYFSEMLNMNAHLMKEHI